jgi:hypothetical protein
VNKNVLDGEKNISTIPIQVPHSFGSFALNSTPATAHFNRAMHINTRQPCGINTQKYAV